VKRQAKHGCFQYKMIKSSAAFVTI